jgi:hypothetical protein
MVSWILGPEELDSLYPYLSSPSEKCLSPDDPSLLLNDLID